MTLLAAPGAEAAPSITYKCTPAPQNCTGWYRSNVSIEWTVLPSDATKTGCANQTFTTDTPRTSVFCLADDGSSATSVEVRISLDKTPPVVTGGQPARAADTNGWYNHAVAVAFSGSDLTSGVASCTATTYGGPDDDAANVQGTCIDNAGNTSAALGYGLKYDATAPAVTAARPDRQPNADGWFNRAVRFDVEGNDTTSGIAACAPVTYGGPDSATASITATCRDEAGNAASRSFALKYDATAPTVTAADPSYAANANGWFNRPVAFVVRGTDTTSGLAECDGATYSGPDSANASVTGVCSDRAGNSSSRAFPLQYDATPPDVGDGQPARAADAAGWYNHPVAVVFSGTDQLSGIDTCSTPPYSGPDSAMAAVVGTCIDKAGNAGAMRPRSLKYDETPPIVTAVRTDRPPDHGAWFNAPVRLALEATDATSGVAECPPVTYGGPDSASVSLTGICRDVAGNAAGRTFPLSFDATPPRLTKLSASGGDRRVTLRWRATGGAAAVEILRSPGLDGAPTSVVFRGAGDGFVDSKVVNGNRYAYEVRVLDAAG